MVPSRRLRLAGGSARPGFLGPSVSSRSFDSVHGLFFWCRSLSHSWLPSSGSVPLAPFIVPVRARVLPGQFLNRCFHKPHRVFCSVCGMAFIFWFGSEVCSHLIHIYSAGLCSLAVVAILLLQSACWQSTSSDQLGRDIGLSLPGGSEGHGVRQQEEEGAHTKGEPRQAEMLPHTCGVGVRFL
jgi:hypothetical protein